jgi:hypothetical protein
MSEDQKDRYIVYLADRVTDLDLDKRTMELVLEDFLKTQQDLREEMAATYHSIISTVKLHGKSAWHYLGSFFTKIFNGCRDFLSLTPGNIEMAVSQ